MNRARCPACGGMLRTRRPKSMPLEQVVEHHRQSCPAENAKKPRP